jgi:hypothetical protein
MLGCSGSRVRTTETKKAKTVTKMGDLLAGHVQRRRVRCGKPNCKCARGEPHTAYYHAWDTDGVRYRRYVRKADVDKVQAACDAHRALQAELRAGRVQYRRTLASIRELIKGLGL